MNILIIEDDESIREFMETFLLDEGYKPSTAANGLEGLKMVEQHLPDLIFLDVYMPVMDGPTFIEEFRQRIGPKPPVIGMSANINDTNRYAQFDGFLNKPFDLEDILACIQEYGPR